VRLGLAWAGGVSVACLLGPVPFALVLAAAAGLAAAEVARSWSRRRHPPFAPLAAGAAAAVTLAAAFGPLAAAGAAVVALVAVLVRDPVADLLGRPAEPGRRPSPAHTWGVSMAVAPAAASLVLLRSRAGTTVTLVLLAAVCLYDAAVFVVGTGAVHAWEGPVAGIVTLLPLTVLVAAVLVPPFRGASPWIMGGLAAVLAPAGAPLASRLLGDVRMRLPALRRLDTLLLLGPAWAVAASVQSLR
jgi:hypothetical protein